MKAACFLAEGFEETEAVTVVDLLRRTGCTVSTIGMTKKYVTSTRGITITADTLLSDWHEHVDCIILPGGMPGATHLAQSTVLQHIVTRHFEEGKLLAAICAAPAITLSPWGLLNGRIATCYPTLNKHLVNATYCNEDVCVDDNLITSKGVGTLLPFCFAIIHTLYDRDMVNKIKSDIIYSY